MVWDGLLPKVDHMGEETAFNRMPCPRKPVALRACHGGAERTLGWLRLLNRRKALIVGAGLVAVALMALIVAQQTPMYKASSRIMLDTRTFKPVSTEQALSGVDTLNLGRHPERTRGSFKSEFLNRPRRRPAWLASNPEFNGTKPPDSSTRSSPPSATSGTRYRLVARPAKEGAAGAGGRAAREAAATTAIPAGVPPSARWRAISPSRCSAAPS